MRAWAHGGGFSVDSSVRIEGADRADRTGQERLLRYCARPPFALALLHRRVALHPVYRNPKPARVHRHRDYAVLAPNAALRSVLAALAPAAVPPAPTSVATRAAPRDRAVSRCLWALLLARIYEALPLLCPLCPSQMRIIACINDAGSVAKVLKHSGASPQPLRIAPAYGPALWQTATAAQQARNDQQWDQAAQAWTGAGVRSAYRLVTRDFRPPLTRHSPATHPPRETLARPRPTVPD